MTLKGSLISHGALRGLRESRFSQDTQQITYLAPIGACDHAARDCVWERFYKEKRENSFFLKDLFPRSGKQSFPSHVTQRPLRTRASLSHSASSHSTLSSRPKGSWPRATSKGSGREVITLSPAYLSLDHPARQDGLWY